METLVKYIDELIKSVKTSGSIEENYKKMLVQQILVIEKLTESYKKIEKEVGIDLITLFKALKNGIWCKKEGKIINVVPSEQERLVLDKNESIETVNWWLLIYQNVSGETIYDWWIDDYGKTWALTKEELE